MAARSVRGWLHNQTAETLRKIHDEIPHGEWAGWRPPDVVPPFSTARFGSESDGLMTGTEARATYTIGNDSSKTLYVHWDNPFHGSNGYHTNTDATHDAFWTATSSSNSMVHFELRPARKVSTDFLPSRDGFKFRNHWDGDTPYSLPPLRGSLLDFKYGNAKNGLCGGFVFAALDYFLAGQQIPQQTDPPFGEEDPLFLYLVDRLFDSFTPSSVLMMLNLMGPLFPDTDEGVLGILGLAEGRAAVMAHQQWPAIRIEIDQGRPAPLFIQTVKSLLPSDLGLNHQIMAYAYETHGHDITMWVYDPNQPRNDNVTMQFNDADVSARIVVTHNVGVHEADRVTLRPIYCFMRTDYTPRQPRIPTGPRLTSAEVLNRGVSLTRSSIKVLEAGLVTSGITKIDVIPNCGEQDFRYEMTSERQEITIDAHPKGYVAPILEWTISGQRVPPGADQTMTVSADREEFLNPVTSKNPDWAAATGAPVTIHTTTRGLSLDLRNEAVDGNYDLSVRVTCAERGQPPSSRNEDTVAFLGAREKVFGLTEAIDRCIIAWIDQLREAVPTDEAIAKSVFASLGHPPDPIWDPDPDLMLINPALALHDPDLESFQAVSEPAPPDFAPDQVDTTTDQVDVLTAKEDATAGQVDVAEGQVDRVSGQVNTALGPADLDAPIDGPG